MLRRSSVCMEEQIIVYVCMLCMYVCMYVCMGVACLELVVEHEGCFSGSHDLVSTDYFLHSCEYYTYLCITYVYVCMYV